MKQDQRSVLRERREAAPKRSHLRRAPKRRSIAARWAAAGLFSLAAVGGLLLGIGYTSDDEGSLGLSGLNLRNEPEPLPIEPPIIAAWKPGPSEEIKNGKALSAKVAQAALTYPRGTSVRQQAKALERRFGVAVSPDVLAPVVESGSRAWGQVKYPQLSGYDNSTMGAMVVTEQTVENDRGERRTESRVLDVRLSLEGTKWKLDQLASTGGSPASLSASLPPIAKTVLRHPNITMPDSARWDVKSGLIDVNLLEAMAAAADKTQLGVAVLVTGHPKNVWNTDKPSAHSVGQAADFYEVEGTDVVDQQEVGSAAFELASSFVANGAQQVGSPWILGAGGSQSFTDIVHHDHLHLQQSAGE